MIKKLMITALAFISLQVNAQKSFEKGTNVIAFGADLGLYNYMITENSTGSTDDGAAANKMLNLEYERGVLNWLGLGAKVQLVDYFSETDPDTGTRPILRAVDASLLVNAHFVRAKYVDMLGGLNIGYSHMNYESRDQYSSAITGGGLMFDLHIQPRFYFGKHVGMFINLGYTHYGYKGMTYTDLYTRENLALDLIGDGANFGLGIQAKF